MSKPRSLAIPMIVSLLIAVTLVITSHSLDYRVRMLQQRCDDVELYYQAQFRELAGAAADSDMILYQRQTHIINKIQQLSHNQHLLIQDKLEPGEVE